MSIFVRPESPPPRQPSPDITPAPLPYPHHPRRVLSQPRIRVHAPSSLNAARSYDHLAPSDDAHTTTSHTRSIMTTSTSSSPRSSPTPSIHSSTDTHSRALSVNVASQLPARSLQPPLPPFVLSSPHQSLLFPKPTLFKKICLPDTDQLASPPELSPRQNTSPPLGKQRSVGMSCLRFFRIRPTSRRQKTAAASM